MAGLSILNNVSFYFNLLQNAEVTKGGFGFSGALHMGVKKQLHSDSGESETIHKPRQLQASSLSLVAFS